MRTNTRCRAEYKRPPRVTSRETTCSRNHSAGPLEMKTLAEVLHHWHPAHCWQRETCGNSPQLSTEMKSLPLGHFGLPVWESKEKTPRTLLGACPTGWVGSQYAALANPQQLTAQQGLPVCSCYSFLKVLFPTAQIETHQQQGWRRLATLSWRKQTHFACNFWSGRQ